MNEVPSNAIKIIYPETTNTMDTHSSVIITNTNNHAYCDSHQITFHNLTTATQFAKEHFPEARLQIMTSRDSAYEAIESAIKLKATPVIDGEELNLKQLPPWNLGALKAQYASTPGTLSKELAQLARLSIREHPRSKPLKHIQADLDEIRTTIDSHLLDDRAALDTLFQKELALRDAKVRAFHSINRDNPHTQWLDTTYNPEFCATIEQQHQQNTKTIIALNGGCGSGKTRHVISPLFDYFTAAGAHPLKIVPKRSLIADTQNDPKHYFNAIRAPQTANAVVGVCNTVLSPCFDAFTKKTQCIFIDEIEELRSHMAGRAVADGSLEARAGLLAKLEELIQQADLVVVADAFMTDDTINWLYELTHTKITVAHQETSKSTKTVHYHQSKNQMLGEAANLIASGKNIAIFCDAKKEKFRDLVTGLELQKADLSYQFIDSEYLNTEEGKKLLEDPDESLKRLQVAAITPAINSGVSIQNKHFDAVFCLCSRTILPTQVIQSMHRFRDVREIHLSFMGKNNWESRSLDRILLGELLKETDPAKLSLENIAAAKQRNHIQKIISRLKNEQEVRVEYDNALLIMMEQMKFQVLHSKEDSAQRNTGQKISKAGSAAGKQYRYTFLKQQARPSPETVCAIKKRGTLATRDEQLLLEAHEIYQALGVTSITDREIEFTEKGGIKLLKNRSLANLDKNTKRSNKDRVQAALTAKIVDTLGINTNDWSGTYNKQQTELLHHQINHEQLQVGNQSIRMRSAFLEVFRNTRLIQCPTTLARRILKEFGLEPHRGSRPSRLDSSGKRNYNYTVLPGPLNHLIEHYETPAKERSVKT